MTNNERWNLALQAHAEAHRAMHERGLGTSPRVLGMPVLRRELSGLGADFRCQGCTPITEESFPWGLALGSAVAGAALLFIAGQLGYVSIGR
jgi:hypothetical protein